MKFDPFALASALTACICPLLKSEDRPEAQRWDGDCCIYPGPGPAAWDNCCETNGQLTITVLPGFPSSTFPNQDQTPRNGCGALAQAVGFEITVLRCVCAMQENGEPCTCEQREQDAANILGDLTAVLTGINCCFADQYEDEEWFLNGWRLVGPEGGCGGAVVTVTVEMDNPCCPPPAPPEE